MLEEEELDDELLHDAGPLRRRSCSAPTQLRALGSIGTDFARDTADVTDRENIQYHWIRDRGRPRDLGAARRRRAEHARGLRRLAAAVPRLPRRRRRQGRDHRRHPGAGGDQAPLHRQPGVLQPAAQVQDRRSPATPATTCAPEINDVSFVGTVHPEHGPGFDLWVGGGLSTNPMLAQKLGVWIPLDEVADVWEGVTSIFRDYGYRRLRSRARLKFLVADWGVEKFREVLENEYLAPRAGRRRSRPASPVGAPRPHRRARAEGRQVLRRRRADRRPDRRHAR